MPAPVEEVSGRDFVALPGGDSLCRLPLRLRAFGDQEPESFAVYIAVDPQVAFVGAVVAHFVVAFPKGCGLADKGEFGE